MLSYVRPVTEAVTFTAKIENTYTGQRYSLAFPSPYNAMAPMCPWPPMI